ncbi:MAG: hypothetical protein LC776_07790 [Acidobacteria bacterium]|nr:hypothetical protein [Acidobacteriota bacterium]
MNFATKLKDLAPCSTRLELFANGMALVSIFLSVFFQSSFWLLIAVLFIATFLEHLNLYPEALAGPARACSTSSKLKAEYNDSISSRNRLQRSSTKLPCNEKSAAPLAAALMARSKLTSPSERSLFFFVKTLET